jgi:hypothetical protein
MMSNKRVGFLSHSCNRLEEVKEHAIELLEQEIGSLENPDSDHEPSATEDDVAPDLEVAVKKLNRATTLLFRILSVLSDQWHPDAKLPALTTDDLDKSIEDTSAAIQKIVDANDSAKAIEAAKKGVVHNLGNGAKSLCVHVKPFLKTFLEVAVQGSAVRLYQVFYGLISRFQFSILSAY